MTTGVHLIEQAETFEDTSGCDMCGAHIDDPCDCFNPQSERRYRPNGCVIELTPCAVVTV